MNKLNNFGLSLIHFSFLRFVEMPAAAAPAGGENEEEGGGGLQSILTMVMVFMLVQSFMGGRNAPNKEASTVEKTVPFQQQSKPVETVKTAATLENLWPKGTQMVFFIIYL